MSAKRKKAKAPRDPRIEVVEIATGEVVKTVKLSSSSARTAERVLRGMLVNMDRERFFAREVDVEDP